MRQSILIKKLKNVVNIWFQLFLKERKSNFFFFNFFSVFSSNSHCPSIPSKLIRHQVKFCMIYQSESGVPQDRVLRMDAFPSGRRIIQDKYSRIYAPEVGLSVAQSLERKDPANGFHPHSISRSRFKLFSPYLYINFLVTN